MGEPAIGPQERQLRTHLPKDYMVAPLSEVHPEIGRIIAAALGGGFESEREALLERIRVLMERYPLYPHLSSDHVGARNRL
jgi:hypothetical protein